MLEKYSQKKKKRRKYSMVFMCVYVFTVYFVSSNRHHVSSVKLKSSTQCQSISSTSIVISVLFCLLRSLNVLLFPWISVFFFAAFKTKLTYLREKRFQLNNNNHIHEIVYRRTRNWRKSALMCVTWLTSISFEFDDLYSDVCSFDSVAITRFAFSFFYIFFRVHFFPPTLNRLQFQSALSVRVFVIFSFISLPQRYRISQCFDVIFHWDLISLLHFACVRFAFNLFCNIWLVQSVNIESLNTSVQLTVWIN